MGDSLAEFLVEATPDPKLRQLMMSMAEAVRTIAYKVSVFAAPHWLRTHPELPQSVVFNPSTPAQLSRAQR